jgi:hypothetical protein
MRASCMAPVLLMSDTPLRLLLPVLAAIFVAGCGTTPSCGGDQDYLTAQERQRLDLPPGVMTTERAAPVVVPSLAPDPQKLDPQPRCLDFPPPFFARKGGKVADSAEEAVKAWAVDWAGRKPDAVIQMYAPTFQAPGEGGSAAFLENRRQQVTTGRAPSANLEEITVTQQGTDRRVVTFVQVFGGDRVRKELTLVREGQDWRIVSERTIEVL